MKQFSSTAGRGASDRLLSKWRKRSARVITTAGSEAKCAACKELGAEVAINYKTENVADRVREFVPAGVDVWWETTREPNFHQAIELLAERGRMIVMAGRDATPAFPVGPFYVKECRLFGFVMFKASPDEQLRRRGRHQPLVRRR